MVTVIVMVRIFMPDKNLKLPPQDIEAERSVLGALMLDRTATVKVADIIAPIDFYHPAHQKIFGSILELFERGEPIDLLTISANLKGKKELQNVGGMDYLSELVANVPTSAHVERYAELVKENRVRRDLIEASSDINEQALDERDFETLLDRTEQKIFNISQRSRPQRFIPVQDELTAAYERIERLHRGEKGALRGLSTHFPQLDNILSGLQASDLIIVGARPSYGKTTLVLDIARQASLAGKSVGIFSLEMSKDQVIDRLIASQAQVPLWRLRTGRLSDELEFALIQQALDELSKAPLYIDDTPSPTTLQMRSMARRLQIEQGLDLLVVDYLQLIQPRTGSESIVQQVTEISRHLKALARELKVPVIAVSQLSRAVDQRESKIPRLSDLRESGCLAGDTLIVRADTGERTPIKTLVGQTGIPVHGLNKNWKIVERKISEVFCSGKKMVYELKTRSGFSIKASSNHPFWKVNGWTRLKELKTGDRIATPTNLYLSAPQNKLSENEIILLAHLLGDGCILPRQPYHYTSADRENIKVVAETAKKLFNIKSKIIRQKNWWHVYLTCPYHLTHHKQHPITKWFESLGIRCVRSFEKEIPQAVFNLNNKKLALFLKHLWATDGHVGIRQHKKDGKPIRAIAGVVGYSTTSQKMAEGVKYLLLRFGIRSKITPLRKGDYRICYQIRVDGAKHQLAFLGQIGCFGIKGNNISFIKQELNNVRQSTNLDVWPKETWKFVIDPIRRDRDMSWREFSNGIKTKYCGTTLFKHGLGVERLNRIATLLHSSEIKKMAQSDIFWDEIVSIKPLGIQKVYDATVPGLHNFVANNIIVENSLEQDADVVLLIYRKDRDRTDLPEEEQNLVELIIAKHRNGPLGSVQLRFDPERVSFRSIDTRHGEEQ